MLGVGRDAIDGRRFEVGVCKRFYKEPFRDAKAKEQKERKNKIYSQSASWKRDEKGVKKSDKKSRYAIGNKMSQKESLSFKKSVVAPSEVILFEVEKGRAFEQEKSPKELPKSAPKLSGHTKVESKLIGKKEAQE